MNILVGYTGFVGSNICASFKFDKLFNSKNIQEAYGLNPDLCIYSGVRAEKYIANNFPDEDLASINQAIDNIKRINPKVIVLISTVDVLDYPYGDEDSKNYSLLPYGKNRRVLEEFVENSFEKYLIVRLPGLYGLNLKKNFIYDYKNQTPKLLNEKKYSELVQKEPSFSHYYHKNEKNFYEINEMSLLKDESLLQLLKNINFSALNFTDSRGLFQFYNLAFLWSHINLCLKNNIKLIHISTEPVSVSEVFYTLENKSFVNEIIPNPPKYNMLTKHWKLFGKNRNYIFNKKFVLNDIKKYIYGSNYSLSVSNMSFSNDLFDEFVSLMKENGYKGVELLPTKIIGSPLSNVVNDKDSINKVLKNQINVSSLQSILYGNSLNLFKEDEVDELIESMKRVVDLAESINCHNLVFGCPKNRNMDEGSDIKTAFKFFREIGDYAHAHNTIIAIEANPVIYNTNFLNYTKDAIDFAKKVNNPGVKVNLDLGTIIYNKEDIDDIFEDIDIINHIHISEPYLRQIKINNIHYKLFEKVIEKNYSHYISLELKEGDFDLKKLIVDIKTLSDRL